MEERIFFNDVSEAMTKKALNPNLEVLVSIESTPEEQLVFWNSIFVEKIIKNNFIVVRISYQNNYEQVAYFDNIYKINSTPSLFYFGPNQIEVTHIFDPFPTPKQFAKYFGVRNNDVLLDVNISQENIVNSNAKTQKNTQNLHHVPAKIRIAVQGGPRLITHAFDRRATVGDLRVWCESVFGDSQGLFVPALGHNLEDSDSTFLEDAGLAPSAKLILREAPQSIEIAASKEDGIESPLLDNQQLNTGENLHVEIGDSEIPQESCLSKSIRLVLRIFDPFYGIEEKEDFFEAKKMLEY